MMNLDVRKRDLDYNQLTKRGPHEVIELFLSERPPTLEEETYANEFPMKRTSADHP